MTTIEEMIEDCLNVSTASNTPFNKWEQDFIDSIAEQYEDNEWLSDKQEEILERIWDKI